MKNPSRTYSDLIEEISALNQRIAGIEQSKSDTKEATDTLQKSKQWILEIIDNAPSYSDMFIGNIGGSLGEVSVLAIIIGGLFLRKQKRNPK